MTENITTPAVAEAKPVAKTKAQPHPCKCGVKGCTGTTMRVFAPGHDQKAIGHLTREVVKNKNMTAVEAVDHLRSIGASELLISKLTAAISREQKNAETAATRKANADAEKAAAKVKREEKSKAEKEAKAAKAAEAKPAKASDKVEFAREQAAKVKADLATKAQAEGASAEAKANA